MEPVISILKNKITVLSQLSPDSVTRGVPKAHHRAHQAQYDRQPELTDRFPGQFDIFQSSRLEKVKTAS